MSEISIVIPCYNVKKKYLETCIDSILNQSFVSFEVILVDDGSDDEFAQDIDSISKLDNRIVVYRQENQGVSVARNKGISIARGNYITFIDADDTVVPYFLEQAIDVAKKNNADVVYGYIRRTKEERINYEYQTVMDVQEIDTNWLKKYHIGYLYSDNEKTFGRGPIARLIKSSIAKKICFNRGVPIGEDILWNLELLENTQKRVLVNSVWYNYIIRSDSVTCRYEPTIINKLHPFYNMLNDYIDDTDSDELLYYNRIIYDLKSYVFNIYLGHKDNKDSFINKWLEFSHICKESPWTEIRDPLVFWRGSIKRKIEWVLFRTKMLFPVLYFKKKLKSHRFYS